MNIEQLKEKWGGSLPQVGDWGKSLNHPHKFKDHNLLSFSYESFDPIPLTREVFFKIEQISQEDGFLRIGEDLDPVFFMPDKGKVWLFDIEIIYLHQLQQLYRLLTGGKELTYTP